MNTPYIISKGRLFQINKSNGCWNRYLLPFKVPEIITPNFYGADCVDDERFRGDSYGMGWKGYYNLDGIPYGSSMFYDGKQLVDMIYMKRARWHLEQS